MIIPLEWFLFLFPILLVTEDLFPENYTITLNLCNPTLMILETLMPQILESVSVIGQIQNKKTNKLGWL